jgi:hypothetical protein
MIIGIVLLFSSSQTVLCETNALMNAGRGDVPVYISDSYDS